jgi:protein-tyrosine-phosphatase
MPEEPKINIDEFQKISPLVRGYELDPTKVYLIVCDGKDFRAGLAYSLFKDLREMHPDIQIAVIASMKPKSIEVMEKKDADASAGTATQE